MTGRGVPVTYHGADEFRWRPGVPVVGDSLTSRVGA